jgi:hypothetical protein
MALTKERTDVWKSLVVEALQRVKSAYDEAKAERRLIHEQEWQAGPGAPSILGEAEVSADTLCGYASTFFSTPEEARLSSLDLAERSSPYSKASLVKFARDERDRYPRFARYLNAVELVRLVLKEAVLLESRPSVDEVERS